MLPVDPHTIKVHGGQVSDQRQRADTSVVAQDRRDLLLVSIADGLSCAMRLEERRGGIGCHAFFAIERHDVDDELVIELGQETVR